ncbi:hypothetical protein OSB04_015117 [Centaurea solstitialis]|uniref:Uncharacterized protein n=1 Tax=Centaurea solstitialis TaxID=347529 RepID=A0AA38W8M4_9ASTR|nr:hypothetical protein OSB04_015117 [Centaurea solstitialis]
MNKLKVPLKDIEHHEVTIDFEKALKILKGSLKSSSTLTDVFLKEIIEKKKRDEEVINDSVVCNFKNWETLIPSYQSRFQSYPIRKRTAIWYARTRSGIASTSANSVTMTLDDVMSNLSSALP